MGVLRGFIPCGPSVVLLSEWYKREPSQFCLDGMKFSQGHEYMCFCDRDLACLQHTGDDRILLSPAPAEHIHCLSLSDVTLLLAASLLLRHLAQVVSTAAAPAWSSQEAVV